LLGTGALLLLLIIYDLATTCDNACQQTRTDTARQRTAQEQARLTVSQPPTDPLCDWSVKPIVLGLEWVELHGDRCKTDLRWDKTQNVELYLKLANGQTAGPFKWGDHAPDDAVAVMSKAGSIPATLQLTPASVNR
jgi:hypothetical protein